MCLDILAETSREGASSTSSGPIIHETCTVHLPSGQILSEDIVHWWSIAFAIPLAVGAWFAFAGVLRLVRPRLAVVAVAVSVVAFLVLTAISFA